MMKSNAGLHERKSCSWCVFGGTCFCFSKTKVALYIVACVFVFQNKGETKKGKQDTFEHNNDVFSDCGAVAAGARGEAFFWCIYGGVNVCLFSEGQFKVFLRYGALVSSARETLLLCIYGCFF